MKRLAPPASNQLHLPLLTTRPSVIPNETQRALVQLLVELLISAIPPRASIAPDGGRHAAEADC
jgi:hypothetical protein